MNSKQVFPFIKGKLGFGVMRLKCLPNSSIDLKLFQQLVDAYISNGFNYFDTAHGYIGGLSELAIRDCVIRKYPRETIVLTDKLSENYFSQKEDIEPFILNQLETLDTDYFDFYLMHAQNRHNFKKYRQCQAYETAFKLKKEGKIKYVGISFHDDATTLEDILKTYPEIDVVQIQFNYLDYLDEHVQSKALYDVCHRYHKPIIVMEPLKGGTLVNLQSSTKSIIENLNRGSLASIAFRYVLMHEDVFMILSGMNSMSDLLDNINTFKNYQPLNQEELMAIKKVVEEENKLPLIGCTSCRYCLNVCPKHILIPSLFSLYNSSLIYEDEKIKKKYFEIAAISSPKECLKCHQCSKICPQKLDIPSLIEKIRCKYE